MHVKKHLSPAPYLLRSLWPQRLTYVGFHLLRIHRIDEAWLAWRFPSFLHFSNIAIVFFATFSGLRLVGGPVQDIDPQFTIKICRNGRGAILRLAAG